MRKLLLWDFDGVIVDSVQECLLTAYNAFLAYQKISSEPITSLNNIPEKHRNAFYRKRGYVRRAGGYLSLTKAIYFNMNIDEYSIFLKIFEEDKSHLERYEKTFFKIRDNLRSINPASWYELHGLYQWIRTNWNRLAEKYDFFIVSNKDRHSISLILKHFELMMKEINIFGNEFSLEKKTIIKHIIKKNNVLPNQVSYVDDNYHHLTDVAELGIRLFFASWGYGEKPLNSSRNIIDLSEKNFIEALLDGHNG
ncbi:HAD hydrolase-like protein [Fibrobacterota bacterium]